MKLLSLNIWGGRAHEALYPYLKEMATDIDIFLFQEVYNGKVAELIRHGAHTKVYAEIADLLPDFVGHFASSEDCIDDNPARGLKMPFGLAGFVKKGIEVVKTGDVFVFGSKNCMVDGDTKTYGRNLQYFEVHVPGKDETVLICNIHGLWNGQGKTDTPERIEQSNRIKQFMDGFTGNKILMGDLNLLPTTESLKILEKGMNNLISSYGITSTRTELYPKPEKFADYVLVSHGIQVESFEVPDIPVSDHRPLILRFS